MPERVKMNKHFAVNDDTARRQGIGGSDAGAAIGVNPWKTPFQLYLEKIPVDKGGVVPEDISYKPAVKRGVRLEPEIIKWVKEDLGITIRKDNTTHFSDKHPFLYCHNDGTVVGSHSIAEIKAPSIHMRDFWGEENTDAVPPYYLAQGVHALACQPEMDGVDFFAYFDPDILHFRLDRSKSLIDAYIKKASRFWGHVKELMPPQPIDENDLIYRYFKKNGKFKSATPDIEKRIKNLIKIKEDKKALDLAEKEEKFIIKEFIANYDGLIINNSKKVSLSRVELKTINEEGFAKKYPDLIDKYRTILDKKSLKKDFPKEVAEHEYAKQSTRLILPK